jgi:hypothetical protein
MKQSYGEYADCEELKKMVAGKKYRLDCGHFVTFNHNLGNNVAIENGSYLMSFNLRFITS